MHRFAIASLPPVANPAAREYLPDAPAAAILPHTPLDDDLLLQAITEQRGRRAAYERGLLTDNEWLSAEKRKHVILVVHTAHEYPGCAIW
ncbi:ATP-dependent RNA helicase [Globisporangium polare]